MFSKLASGLAVWLCLAMSIARAQSVDSVSDAMTRFSMRTESLNTTHAIFQKAQTINLPG